MDTNRKLTDKTGKKPRTPSHKYSFRLNEEQNIRFNELLCKAGLEHNRSRFIVKRIFEEEFVVIKRDPSKVQFVYRHYGFAFQRIEGLFQSQHFVIRSAAVRHDQIQLLHLGPVRIPKSSVSGCHSIQAGIMKNDHLTVFSEADIHLDDVDIQFDSHFIDPL